MNRIVFFSAYLVGLIAPYFLTIFYLRTFDAIALLLLEFLCLLVVVILTIYLYRTSPNKKLKVLFPFVSFSIIAIYLLTYSNLIKAADYVFLIRRQTELEKIVSIIDKSPNKQSEIKRVTPELAGLGIQSISLVDDQIISFTIDCFLDNGSGLAFSKNLQVPVKGSLGCGGNIIRWEKLQDNWFAWGEN